MNAPRPKRPFSVTALAVLVLSFAVLHAFGVWEAVRYWGFLQELPLAVPPGYLLGRNLLWFVIGTIISIGLWRGSPWAWGDAQIAAGVYAAWYWLDRVFLAPAAMLKLRWPSLVALTILGLLLTFIALRRPGGRAYFMHETTTKENQEI